MTTVTSPSEKAKLPPTVKTPAIATMIQALLDQFGTLERYQKKYGEIFYSPKSSLYPPNVIFSNPKAIEQVFTADPSLFEIDQQSTAPVRVLLGDRSLVLLDGIEHKRQRKLLMPPFHGERMKSYGQTMVKVTKEVIAQWQVGQTICIRDYTQEISLQVILKTIFGLDEGQRYDRLKAILVDWLEIFNSPLTSFFLFFPALQKDLGVLTPWGKFLRQKRQIREILQSEGDRRRSNPDTLGEDILSLLIEARYEDGQPMSDGEIRDELMTMLFAGHETTASSLAWSFYWLHRLPEVGQKCQAELNSLAENAEFTDLVKLPYLSAVVSETLRLNPVVVFVGRQLKEPFELMGYQFKPGTSLFPSIYLTHQREDIYPEPKKFKPERFLEKQFTPYEFLPFGGGNRRCLGYAFALFEMKLVLATILSHVELELLDNRPLKSTRRGITFTPAGGVKMRVKALKN
ncbi:putative cytochrome P450 110 [Hyella patelloides LEGE 07179]|uniref:Putative cytochrome P450 110 n=1 Tax=Hyella patelloides LEGE 07179 TaxID=945734 RepID=A0A563VUI4_9CYAN|nr:cytochrome P450 [Hyella patelloides]VEP15136.1 putative cytochrome P450 110 [Hyella patelloides LEGE 07179]